jgi:hypothetical protein
MLHTTPSWLPPGSLLWRVQKHRRWRPLLWAGALVAVLLLARQAPMSGALLAADVVAKPTADTVALNTQWQFVDESKPGSPPAQGLLTVATSNAPAPVAARFHISSSMQALSLQLSEGDLGGVPLAQVEELDYCTRLVDGPRPYAVTLQINVDADVTDGDQSWQGRLVYTPSYNGAVIQGEWQCWNTLVGKWWATGGPMAEVAPADSPQPLGTLLAHFPNLGVNATYSVVALKAGDGWRDFMGEASPVAISVEGERYDVAFGAPPENNEILLPVVFNEPQGVPQVENDGNSGNNKDKPKKNQEKAKQDKAKPDKDNNEERNVEENERRNNVNWEDVNWDDFDWEGVNWDEVKWDEIDWQHFGWRADAIRAFVDDVKACKKQGWQDGGFKNQGQCVAYYVSAHSPAYLVWNRGWNSEGWERNWGNHEDDDRGDDDNHRDDNNRDDNNRDDDDD